MISETKPFKKVDHIEKQKRIYEISLMLRRKPVSYIVEFAGNEWGLQKSQAYNYIKEARAEWRKYFEKLKGDGTSYHVTQLRDLKDQAYNQKTVIGRGEDKQVVDIPNLYLVLEIMKEEARIMGIKPADNIVNNQNVYNITQQNITVQRLQMINNISEVDRNAIILEAAKRIKQEGRTDTALIGTDR